MYGHAAYDEAPLGVEAFSGLNGEIFFFRLSIVDSSSFNLSILY